ncbi:MAG: TonB-dependent receptor [Halieaceae bacterium]|jgi:iron complex outermembrane receptor protein|nr:TonB-dependent receptor [Halieaceae bacterium]
MNHTRILHPASPRCVLTLAIAATLSPYALAQAPKPLEEVVVTAQKREQSLLSVGLAVSVADEQEIRDRRITAVTDISLFTPNAAVKEFFPGLMPIITVRAVGLNDFNAANNPSTGVYVDEVSLSSLALLSSDFFDLAQMEVLKGPQGTVYGRNATGGALNVMTARPDFDAVSGRLAGGIGNYEAGEVEGMLNVPVSDRLALRFAGKVISQGEGYWDNRVTGSDVGERDVVMGRAWASWRPTDLTEVSLKLEHQSADSELGAPEFFGLLPTATEPNCPGLPTCSNFLGYTDGDGDPFRGDWSIDPAYEMEQTNVTLVLDHELPFATFRSVTGYVDFERSYGTDVDASPARITDFYNVDDVQQISQEFRLDGGGADLIWQLGLFYSRDEILTTYAGELQDIVNTTTFSSANIDATTVSAFANAEYALTDTWTLVAGLRLSEEEKSNDGFTQDLVSLAPASFLSMAPFGSPPVTLAAVDDEISDTSVDWRLGLNWQLADDAMLFLSAAQGTKSGGFFTGVAVQPEQLQPYDPENLLAYELGIKGQLVDAGLRYEASVFFYDYDDVQSYIRDNSGALPVQRLGNIPGAEIMGADFQIGWFPAALEGFSATIGGGLLDTDIEAFVGPEGLVPSGNELPDAPELSFSIDLRYRMTVTSTQSLELALDSRYQAEVFRDALNDPLLASDSFTVTNARATWSLSDSLEFALWGRNITDESYVIQGVNQLSFGNGFRVYGPPRTFGLSVTKHFD